jgi:hypothetical protein
VVHNFNFALGAEKSSGKERGQIFISEKAVKGFISTSSNLLKARQTVLNIYPLSL